MKEIAILGVAVEHQNVQRSFFALTRWHYLETTGTEGAVSDDELPTWGLGNPGDALNNRSMHAFQYSMERKPIVRWFAGSRCNLSPMTGQRIRGAKRQVQK